MGLGKALGYLNLLFGLSTAGLGIAMILLMLQNGYALGTNVGTVFGVLLIINGFWRLVISEQQRSR